MLALVSTRRRCPECAMQQTRKEVKAQASKLAEIRKALISAGYDTAARQAAALGVGRGVLPMPS